jgi:hypothetical protein
MHRPGVYNGLGAEVHLADEGYLDVLSIEIYDKTTASANVTNTGNGQDKDNGYYYTMKNVRLDATGYPDAPPHC